jgi:hypothetical protein
MYDIIYCNIETIFDNHSINQNIDESFELIIQYYNSLDEKWKDLFDYIIENYKINDTANIDFSFIKWNWLLFIRVMNYFWKTKVLIDNNISNRKFYWILNGYKEILSNLNDIDANIYWKKVNTIIINLAGNSLQSSYVEPILNEILQRKLWNIKIKVNQIDVEIESDQNKVIELIEEFWFDSQLNKFLTELKNKNIADEDEMQFAWTIATYREFFWKIILAIANKIAEFNQEEISQYQSWDWKDLLEIANCRKYIQEKINLSSKDNKFIDSYVDILHKEWWHNMFSNKEYFRLTKNIGIEILYMLLSKTKEFNQ